MIPIRRLLPHFDIIALLAACLYIMAGVPTVPFHGDEATQVYMSRDYAYQFMQRDLSLVRYSDPPVSPQEQELRLLNGTVNKYSIGLAWHLAGFSLADINEQWDWGADYAYNVSTNHAPAADLLNVARLPSALFLCLGAVAIYGIGLRLGGRGAALLALLFYALNPTLLINGRRAMMEGSFIAFTLLAVLAALAWAGAKSARGRLIFALLLGVSCGMALASKHTAVFVLVPLALTCGVVALVSLIRGRDVSGLLTLLAGGLLAGLVFYALNPAWWGDPLGRAGYVLDMRQRLLTGQTAAFGGYADVSQALGGFFRQAFVGLPQYFEVGGWENYIADQIAAYESGPWRGISLGGSAFGGVILLLLTIAGLAVLAVRRSLPMGVRAIALAWSASALLSVLLLTPLEWARYCLPALPVVGLLASLAVWAIGMNLWRRVRGHSG
ncbi:MAG: phospholipid carrier-dependent glycosyltransferase [Pleurocapsa minor GSE-CHR-MK-17-07R]|nr:phospholipid carrier-dependent glycosyltransferase [Pleurocapsa minor GSE-CHR-MK 17-07R]